MNELTYIRILSEEDADIPELLRIYHQPRIAHFISIGDNYFQYVTGTESVYFYKVYDSENLIGAIHLEKCKDILYMDILILPEFQKKGLATRVIRDIQNDIFALGYKRIEISIDEKNTRSIKLFENAGFVFMARDDELLSYVYEKD
ncbi:MAG: GNAT family N-acetyltransferase [Clostridia bacterium]|nr:GNAT family N-acetyltransferase [Clostridia bacterium]